MVYDEHRNFVYMYSNFFVVDMIDFVVRSSSICMVRHVDRSMFDFENVQPSLVC